MSETNSKTGATALSVLLVEDNPLNQQLTVAMLTEWGHRVDVANDGEEALALHEHGKYDLILMDIMMPVMDGIQATKIIRGREVATGCHAVIIAMTANSPDSNREKCIGFGMDDYFVKPFTVENFHGLMKKYVKLHDHALKTKTAIGQTEFNYAAALKEADPLIVSMIARPFLEDLPQQLLTMRRSWEKQDMIVFQREAHTLSGLLGSFNAEPAQQIAAQIARHLRTGHIESVMTLFNKLEEEITLFSEELRLYDTA